MNAATPLLTFFLCIASLGAQAQTSGCISPSTYFPEPQQCLPMANPDTGTWENLDDTGEYSGTETSTLNIDVELDMDGAGCRCLVPSAAGATPDSMRRDGVECVWPLAPAVSPLMKARVRKCCFGTTSSGWCNRPRHGPKGSSNRPGKS